MKQITSCTECPFHRIETPWTGVQRECIIDTFLDYTAPALPRNLQGIHKDCPLPKELQVCITRGEKNE
jgi:hypothetical protein